MSEFAHTSTAPNQAVSWQARCQVTAKTSFIKPCVSSEVLVTKRFCPTICFALALTRMRKVDTIQRSWSYYLQNIFTWIIYHKAKLFRLSEQMCLWKSLTIYIPIKLMNFTCLGFLWIFSRSQLLKRHQCSPKSEEAGSTSDSHTSLREDSITVAENLNKLLIFWKTDEMKKEIKNKEIRRRSLSKSHRESSTRAMPWALLLENPASKSSGILRQKWCLITILYIIIYNIKC